MAQSALEFCIYDMVCCNVKDVFDYLLGGGSGYYLIITIHYNVLKYMVQALHNGENKYFCIA